MTTHACAVCKAHCHGGDCRPLGTLTPMIAQRMMALNPALTDHDFICRRCIDDTRRALLEELIREERGELAALERSVVKSLVDHETISHNVDVEATRSRGEIMSDAIASFGGSWGFVLGALGVIALWMLVNAVFLARQPFDPYPFILLNLVLSCVAALQAPIIMMSQNRAEARDRLRAENDYKVNLKAELEIRHLHEKVDHLLTRQWERLAAIQQLQVDMMEEIGKARDTAHTPHR